ANAIKPIEAARRPAKERISPPSVVSKTNNDDVKNDDVEDEYMDDDLLESDADFDVICNVVSILPLEYDV
ncbi:hypothetical protein A2U01_0107355, partial [Trifolium medium]|nr:hypothetical protein [Trifolium medium]